LTPSEENTEPSEGGPSGPSSQVPVSSRVPRWAEAVPFFLSAAFFLSAFFVIFAPLPILFLFFRKGRKWAYFAALTNSLWVGLAAGPVSLVFYLGVVIALALPLAELLNRRKSLEKSALITLLTMGLVAGALGGAYAHIHHLNPIQILETQVFGFVDYLSQSMSANSVKMDPAELEEWKHSLIVEFPSGVAVFALVLVWANLILSLRANPGGLRDKLGLDASFIKKWKAPEYLVWPTLATGFFLLKDFGLPTSIALNVFKFLMAIYAIQGLSILSHLFDVWKFRGMFRVLGFSLLVLFMLPLVLSLGFFDLWFDFRSKFRQS